MPRCFATDCAGRYFRNKEALQQHLRSSSLPHPVCNLCKRRFINETSKNEHMAARHPPTFPCEDCQRNFNSLSALNDHYRGTPYERHPNCIQCGLGFRNIAERDAHEAKEHPQVKCVACNDEVVNEDRLQAHYAERSPPHSLCDMCQQGFKDAAELLSHKSSAHPACDGCKVRFKSQNDLDNHVKTCSPTVEERTPIYTTSGSIQSDIAIETGHPLYASAWSTSSPVVQADSHGQPPLGLHDRHSLLSAQWRPSTYLYGQRTTGTSSSSGRTSGVANSTGLSNVPVPTHSLPRHSPSWQTTPNHNLNNSLQALSLSSTKFQQNQKTQNLTSFDQSGVGEHPRSRYLGNGIL